MNKKLSDNLAREAQPTNPAVRLRFVSQKQKSNSKTQSRESSPNSYGSEHILDVNNNHAPRNKCCSFCWNLARQKNEELGLAPPDKDSEGVWSFHSLALKGVIKCPLLWFHVCKICGATEIHAHTEKHCPNRKQMKDRNVSL